MTERREWLVIDASAVIAYYRGEPGGDVIIDLLSDPAYQCVIHAINLCEVFYQVVRDADIVTAHRVIADFVELGMIVSSDLDAPFWQTVGLYKAAANIPFADCFVLALARWLDAEIITADRGDFESLAESGACRVRFIR